MSNSTWRIEAGQTIEGFSILKVTPLPQIKASAVEALHEASGARFLHVHSSDEENLFTIAFRTPPPDDTGVPHILEHSVLCGSRKYPVKDPFVEMLKRSMATFLNAMTDSDMTLYPVASNLKKDFFNLADVYCDAVLHPRISPLTLKQEGHHLSFTNPESPETSSLRINGIVYNEMKGAYSNVESLNYRMISKYLFPDSPYGKDSGGEPTAIPQLTYEQFQRFYRSFYHPSNARIFIYGNIPTEEHLSFLNQRLSDCPPPPSDQADSSIPSQPRWQRPRRIKQPYPADKDSEQTENSLISVNWLIDDFSDPLTDLAMDLIYRLLLGNAAAPLHKALIDSHLGKGLTATGYQGGARETSFHVGLKGTSPEKTEAVEKLILDTLEQTASRGFSPDHLAVAFHQMQYEHREINGQYPLKLMSWTYNAWNYDLDPLIYYQTKQRLNELNSIINQDPKWLNSLIQEKLLANPHRLTLTLIPDPGMQQHRDEQLSSALAERKAAMSTEEIQKIQREAAHLEDQQSRPNSPEELKSLPQLPISAIPEAPREIPHQKSNLSNDAVFLHNQIFSNQINYLKLGIDLTDLPRDLWPWASLFCLLFSQLGSRKNNYETMAQRVAGATSLLRADNFIATSARDPDRILTQFTINTVALDESLPRALDIIHELLFDIDFNDRRRLRDVIEQTRENYLSSIIPNGYRLAALHAARSLSPVSALGELCDGIPQLRLINQLMLNFDEQADQLVEKMRAVHDYLCRRRRMTISFTGSHAQADVVQKWAGRLEKEIDPSPSDSPAENPRIIIPAAPDRLEGMAFMADVAYCAVCLPAPAFNDSNSVPLKLLAHILNFSYMWENIRVRGGAYGAACGYDPGCSLIKLISHQDPDIVNTMRTCDRLVDYLKSKQIDPDELDRARIACAKINQRPIRPGTATNAVFTRYLCELTPAIRRQRRKQLLQVSPRQVLEAGIKIFSDGMKADRRCVISSRLRLEQANRELPQAMRIENLLTSTDNQSS